MIDKEIARALLPFVHSEHYQALMDYVTYRQSVINKALPYAANIEDIRDMQGAYKELGILEQLREWVVQDSKKEEAKPATETSEYDKQLELLKQRLDK